MHRLKYFVNFGTGLSVVAFGLLIHFRSAEHGGVAGLIAGEVLLGIACEFGAVSSAAKRVARADADDQSVFSHTPALPSSSLPSSTSESPS